MLKKYMNSFVAMKYVAPEFFTCAAILVCSFLYTRMEIAWLLPLLYILSAAIIVILILYFVGRHRLSRDLDQIHHKKEYDKSIALGYCLFLENRMAAYTKGRVIESDYKNITDATMITGKQGKQAVRMKIEGFDCDAQITTQQQGERLAAFLRLKNPDIHLHDLKTKGSGSFRAIDLVPAERNIER